MNLSKILLTSVITVLSSSAIAMESMSDDTLAEITGQAGITATIQSPAISFETRIHDSNGFAGATNAGVIILGGASATSSPANGVKTSITPPASGFVIAIDAGSVAAAGPAILNINVSTTGATTIHTGTLAVADSAGMGAAITNETKAIMNDATITVGNINLNIQLGNESQGHMAHLATAMTGGLSIANFSLNDTVGLGSIAATNIALLDTGGGANLTVVADVDVVAAGLKVTTTQLGTVAGGFDARLTALQFGTAAAIGNVEVIGLNMNGTTITLAGH